MHLLCMDAGYDTSSPSSLSAEDCLSSSSGLERRGEGRQLGPRSTKRLEKNRDAARKSRRKQTERADELHEELQCLEQSNTAFQKEIAALKKELHLYETALERHKPQCRLSMSASSSPAQLSASSATCGASSSLPQPSNSPPPSRSTSLNASMGLQTFKYIEKPCVSPLAASPTTTTTTAATSSASTSAETFTASSSPPGSSPAVIPYSASFSTQPVPHSLFSQLPQITSRPTNVTPVCNSTAARLRSERIHGASSASQSSCFTRDRDSSLAASASMAAPFTPVEAKNTSAQTQECSMNVPQLYSNMFSGNPNSPCLPCSLLPSPLREAAPQTQQPSRAPPLVWKPSYCEQVSDTSESLLSLLTVPSPLTVCQTTSNGFRGPAAQPLLSSPPDPEDPSLSELLEINDWILNGLNNN